MLATPWSAKTDESMTLSEWTPSVDIGEDEKEYLVKAELPEVKKEDIKVCADDGTLSISGERKVEKEEKNMKFHRPVMRPGACDGSRNPAACVTWHASGAF
jgi:HSP20 family protein